MKTNVIILVLIFIVTLGFAQEKNSFGEKISSGKIISSDQVITTIGENESMELRVEGIIKEVCQQKGCWMTMDLGNGESMRITFKDYGFFIPEESSGFGAIIEGIAQIKEQSVETLRHYAEDAGKSKEQIESITSPVKKLTFVASGVIIKAETGD